MDQPPAQPTPTPPTAARSHLTTDLRFSAPASWEDRSVLMLTAPPVHMTGGDGDPLYPPVPEPPPFAVTLHRDTPRDGETLRAYVDRQLDAARGAIRDLSVLRHGTRAVGGLDAVDVEFTWMAEGGLMRQHQVHVLRQGRVFTWTATGSAARYANYVGRFAELLASVRFVSPALTITPAVIPGAAPGGVPAGGA